MAAQKMHETSFCEIKSIQLEPNKKNLLIEEEINACIFSGVKKTRGKAIGKGENAEAFKLNDSSTVVKVSKFKEKKNKKLWETEGCTALVMGRAQIGPQIYQIFECQNNGFIVMDFLRVFEKLPDGTQIRKEINNEIVDFLKLIPQKIQLEFVRILSKMISIGYIHMDNHLSNLGFVGAENRPVAFDFGFTQKRELRRPSDKNWALCFSVFQLLEHAPLDQLKCGVFWNVATSLLRSEKDREYFPPSCMSPEAVTKGERFGLPMTDLEKMLPKKLNLHAIEGIANHLIDKENYDLVVGSLCYGILIQFSLEDRFKNPWLLDTIYEIRQGKYEKKVSIK